MTWAATISAMHDCLHTIHGEDVTFTPAGGSGPESVRGVINLSTEEIGLDGETPIVDRVPTVLLITATLSRVPRKGDAITARGVDYTIARVDDGDVGRPRCKLLEA